MTEQGCLKASSVLFWLAALLAVGIIFVGGRFLFDPFAAARDFGVLRRTIQRSLISGQKGRGILSQDCC